jgi:hypothetical protein
MHSWPTAGLVIQYRSSILRRRSGAFRRRRTRGFGSYFWDFIYLIAENMISRIIIAAEPNIDLKIYFWLSRRRKYPLY